MKRWIKDKITDSAKLYEVIVQFFKSPNSI